MVFLTLKHFIFSLHNNTNKCTFYFCPYNQAIQAELQRSTMWSTPRRGGHPPVQLHSIWMITQQNRNFHSKKEPSESSSWTVNPSRWRWDAWDVIENTRQVRGFGYIWTKSQNILVATVFPLDTKISKIFFICGHLVKRSHHPHHPIPKSTKNTGSGALVVLPRPHTTSHHLTPPPTCSFIFLSIEGNYAMEFKAKPAGLKAQHRPLYDLTFLVTFIVSLHHKDLTS